MRCTWQNIMYNHENRFENLPSATIKGQRGNQLSCLKSETTNEFYRQFPPNMYTCINVSLALKKLRKKHIKNKIGTFLLRVIL